ncbi:MAG: hypothetical protein HY445_01300 [Candidatus Niyogibacteria bacterium]|nr:hypothetical protein [Candidatus Niyogibacteria bacterium]
MFIGFEKAIRFFASKDKDSSNGKFVTYTTDFIHITSPKENQAIISPFIVRGEARGTWYFEASFPLVLVDWDGRIIAQSHAEAQGEWMTEEYVPFEGKIEFEKPYQEGASDFMKRGAIIFQKDNPSGLPQYDAAVEIPILFE